MAERRLIGGGGGPTWGVAEYGDPSGHPLVLHHGLVGSAVLPDFWHEYAAAAGVRLIAVERPGYGLTPPLEMTAVAEWSALMRPVLDALAVTEFDVAAISAGAPYAYALAAGLAPRVRRAWVLSGLPYVCDPAVRGCYPQPAQPVWELYRSAPPDEMRAHFAAAAPRFAAALAQFPTALAALAEMAGHEHHGPAREARLQVRPWGFVPGDVRQPARLWHTPADDLVPYRAVQATAALLPRATITDQYEPTHTPTDTTLRALFDELAATR
ncbi:alpha/beta hydrolase [Streptomyces sp. NPDC047315]|uniref:alpha/beta fold hydrolase n=1 Tax=Streptomyces sp. NPDC047315 TaxID=3155142 RepID=UPI0033C2BBB2